jgi:hypothetical protein
LVCFENQNFWLRLCVLRQSIANTVAK